MTRFIVFFIFLAIPAISRAETISIKTMTTISVSEETIWAQVVLINEGDASAHDLKITARLGKQERVSETSSELAPRQAFSAKLPLDIKPCSPGVHAVEIMVDFHDLAAHAFSAVSAATFVHKESVSPMVFVKPGETILRGRAKLDLEVRNQDQASRQVKIRLLSPREFRVDPTEREITLAAGELSRAAFELENISGRERADYPIQIIMEYAVNGQAHASVVEQPIKVQREEKFFLKYRIPLIFVTGLLALAVVIVQIWPASKGRAGNRTSAP